MENFPENHITSKELLKETGISRATLNNYIKIGILPRPFVGKAPSDLKGAKKIGYFPRAVLDRIYLLRQLKKEGKTIQEISLQLDCNQGIGNDELNSNPTCLDQGLEKNLNANKKQRSLVLTFNDLDQPAYLLNFDFCIEWINHLAEQKIFRQRLKDKEPQSIFRWFFHWEFHNHVSNWRDVILFHMSFAKLKYNRTWMKNLYEGISAREIEILEDIYDQAKPFTGNAVSETPINLSHPNGLTETYRIYNLFCCEGLFLVYG